MTLEERAEIVKKNPEYGALACRCEQVTEAEIRAAIRRPVGATTIDGVKRRTCAGMGRRQGGFMPPQSAGISRRVAARSHRNHQMRRREPSAGGHRRTGHEGGQLTC
ncbi:MAG: (2Fe-2S)-binding protein [Lachnospiraceae bacterium]